VKKLSSQNSPLKEIDIMSQNQPIDEHLFEIYARLSLYEFLLEILHANLFRHAPNPKAELDRFGAEVLDLIHKGYPEGSPFPLDDRTIERMREIADHFIYKVSRRMEKMP
jgi:hypothetical protein